MNNSNQNQNPNQKKESSDSQFGSHFSFISVGSNKPVVRECLNCGAQTNFKVCPICGSCVTCQGE